MFYNFRHNGLLHTKLEILRLNSCLFLQKRILMPKYRLLNAEELKQFEKEFVDYLVVNGIDASSWQKMKEEDSEKAARIMALFSDVVFEKVLRQAQNCIKIQWPHIFVFHYGADKAELLIASFANDEVVYDEDTRIDLDWIHSLGRPININSQTKAYEKEREIELFEMLSSGCVIEDGKVFEHFKKIYREQAQ